MAKRRKLTANQQAFRKQINRIRNFVRRAEKRGYVFEENVIPTLPKRVTKKAIERAKNLTPEKLYENAVKLDIETGEIVPALEARKEARRASARRAAETRRQRRMEPAQYDEYLPSFTDMVISQFRSHIAQFNEYASSMLRNWLDQLIATQGVDDVAEMLNRGAENGVLVTYQIVYKQDAILQYMSDMLDYLPETGPLFKEEFMDAIEIMEDWESPV